VRCRQPTHPAAQHRHPHSAIGLLSRSALDALVLRSPGHSI
jgi:hypothetical protein